MDRHTREEIEMIIDEKNREYFANKKKKAKDNYEKKRCIYGFYKDKPKSLIGLLKTVQDIRQIPDCGKLADELLNIKIESKKNRSQKKCRLFVENLNKIVNPKVIINEVFGIEEVGYKLIKIKV